MPAVRSRSRRSFMPTWPGASRERRTSARMTFSSASLKLRRKTGRLGGAWRRTPDSGSRLSALGSRGHERPTSREPRAESREPESLTVECAAFSLCYPRRVTCSPCRASHDRAEFWPVSLRPFSPSMTRLLTVTMAALLFSAATALAQSQQQPEPRPRPGTIIDTPSTGRITDAPTVPQVTDPSRQQVERFEAVGNVSVASDTIRVYLGVVPGEPYDAQALQRNFLNLWQTGLFDDIRIESEQGTTGVIVRAIVKERPRIGSEIGRASCRE